jgi:hypothetical protein
MAKKTKEQQSVMTFADEAKRIENKYKDKIFDPIAKQAYRLEMQQLQARNEMAKAMYENTEKMRQSVQQANSKVLAKGVMSKGGMLPKYYLGNPLPKKLPTFDYPEMKIEFPRNGGLKYNLFNMPTPTPDSINPSNYSDTNPYVESNNFNPDIWGIGPNPYGNGKGSFMKGIKNPSNFSDTFNNNKISILDNRKNVPIGIQLDKNGNIQGNPNQKPGITMDKLESAMNNSFGTPKEQVKTSKDTNLNPLAAGLKSMQLLNSLKNAMTPALQETPILPDYSKSDEAFSKMGYNDTEAINQINRANNLQRSQIEDNTMSDAVRQARLAGNNVNLMNSIAGNMLSSQQIKNAILGQKGSYELNKAGATAQGLYQNRVDNLQNLAAKKLAGEQFIQNLSQVGSEVNKYQMYKDMLKNTKDLAILKTSEGFNYLKALSDTFGVDITALDEYKKYIENPSEENRAKLQEAIKIQLTKK